MIRRVLVGIYDLRDEFMDAIDILKVITYEGDAYEDKIEDWLNIATYWFELKDSTSAESYVTKIMHVLHHTTDN